jgi:hypothetical protein
MRRNAAFTLAEARLVRRATAFDDDTADDIVVEVPEDITALTDDELSDLMSKAREAFDALGESDLTAEVLDSMESLAEVIEALASERQSRDDAEEERVAKAAALKARVAGESTDDEADEPEVAEDEADEPVAEADDESDDEAAEVVAEAEQATKDAAEKPEPVAAAAKEPRSFNITVDGGRSRRRRDPMEGPATRELTFRGSGGGRLDGRSLTPEARADLISKRVRGVSMASIEAARNRGQSFSQRVGTMSFARSDQPGFDPNLVIETDSAEEIERVVNYATDESRLQGGSLTAAGTGWCSPSEVIYELFDCGLAPGAGLFSIPEVTLNRGGLIWEPGISFSDVVGNAGFFGFDEDEAIAGDYANTGTGESDKPCYEIVCGTPEEVRLAVIGACFTGDILQRRTNPERIARFLDVAMAVHLRRLSDNRIAAIEAGSTTITQPANQAGTVAPTLSFFELLVEYQRNRANLSENASMEAVLPHWARGAFRADLARRLGVDLIDVGDARLDAYIRSRGVNPQYVYGWQGLDAAVSEGGSAGAAPTQWPTTMKALVYPAGGWVAGTSDIIEIDTLYDSSLLARNKYTALFMEEGWAVFNKGCDSYVLEFNMDNDGATHGGIDIDPDGSVVPVV